MKKLCCVLVALLALLLCAAALADTMQVTTVYPSMVMAGESCSYTFTLDDDIFDGDPAVYNQKTAQASIALATAAFRS